MVLRNGFDRKSVKAFRRESSRNRQLYYLNQVPKPDPAAINNSGMVESDGKENIFGGGSRNEIKTRSHVGPNGLLNCSAV